MAMPVDPVPEPIDNRVLTVGDLPAMALVIGQEIGRVLNPLVELMTTHLQGGLAPSAGVPPSPPPRPEMALKWDKLLPGDNIVAAGRIILPNNRGLLRFTDDGEGFRLSWQSADGTESRILYDSMTPKDPT